MVFVCASSSFLATAAGTALRSAYWLQVFCTSSRSVTPSTVAGPLETKLSWMTLASAASAFASGLGGVMVSAACAVPATSVSAMRVVRIMFGLIV